MEILEWKNIITKIKNTPDKLEGGMEMTPYTWRYIIQPYKSERKKFFKWTEPLEPGGWHQKGEHLCHQSPKRTEERVWCRKNIWGNKGWKLPILQKDINLLIQEAQQTTTV